MMAIAPNLTVMVGELVGARLIAHAGMLGCLVNLLLDFGTVFYCPVCAILYVTASEGYLVFLNAIRRPFGVVECGAAP